MTKRDRLAKPVATMQGEPIQALNYEVATTTNVATTTKASVSRETHALITKRILDDMMKSCVCDLQYRKNGRFLISVSFDDLSLVEFEVSDVFDYFVGELIKEEPHRFNDKARKPYLRLAKLLSATSERITKALTQEPNP